ncbi:hypothetical protein BDN70DRAFT_368021 [Pholiota conissans]|uniref:Uncharacterized protein n=1 Tax=Pholiota conissans TaxID=109636 RepID=A0A9P5ZE24_9AGAR|nr:hypothetical protein BDN70DRAFT_368021 [Pholiota conissans]
MQMKILGELGASSLCGDNDGGKWRKKCRLYILVFLSTCTLYCTVTTPDRYCICRRTMDFKTNVGHSTLPASHSVGIIVRPSISRSPSLTLVSLCFRIFVWTSILYSISGFHACDTVVLAFLVIFDSAITKSCAMRFTLRQRWSKALPLYDSASKIRCQAKRIALPLHL